jgi:hypothetical protein
VPNTPSLRSHLCRLSFRLTLHVAFLSWNAANSSSCFLVYGGAFLQSYVTLLKGFNLNIVHRQDHNIASVPGSCSTTSLQNCNCILVAPCLGYAVIFAVKRNEVKRKWTFFTSMGRKAFFPLFRISTKHRNLKRNENRTKQKQNKKEAKICHRFRFEAKWSETEMKLFCFDAKRCFLLVFASEAKSKWNEAKTKRKRSENFKAKKDKVNFLDNL